MHCAVFRKSEYRNCVGAEKPDFVGAEGATLLQWKTGGRRPLSSIAACFTPVVMIASVSQTWDAVLQCIGRSFMKESSW